MVNFHRKTTHRVKSERYSSGRAQAGQSLIEVTLSLPMLLLIMVGVLDLGRAFHVYTTVINASNEGARYAALHPTDSIGIRDAIEQEATGSNLDLSLSYVEIETPDGIAAGHPITVNVTYQFALVTELVLGTQNISIHASTTTVIE